MAKLNPKTLKTYLSRLSLLFIFVTAVWLTGFALFLFTLPTTSTCPSDVDSFIVLTGGKERIEQALETFAHSKANKLLISGVGKGVIISDFKDLLKKYDVDQERIVLGAIAQDTIDNSLEALIFSKLNNVKSICLVSSSYHIPRSLALLSYHLEGARIYAQPTFSEKFKAEDYWCAKPSLFTSWKEYNKFLLTYLDITLRKVDTFNKDIIEKVVFFST